jgi:hypothetical protein
MRGTLIVLSSMLLAGCIKDSASYYIDNNSNDHAITVRAEQEYFWSDRITLTLVASNMPDCLRRFDLQPVAADDVNVELFSSAPGMFTVRSGEQVMQVDAQTCTTVAGTPAFGQALGIYHLDGEKMAFKKDPAAIAPPAEAPVEVPD